MEMAFKSLPEDSGKSITTGSTSLRRPARQPQYPGIDILYKIRINPKLLNIGVKCAYKNRTGSIQKTRITARSGGFTERSLRH